MEKEKLYGFYSEQSVLEGHGSFWYSTPDGREVEVTLVDSDKDSKHYLWPDKIFLGEVVSFIRSGAKIQRSGKCIIPTPYGQNLR